MSRFPDVWPCIKTAVFANETDQVRNILSLNGASCCEKWPDGFTVLCTAIKNENEEIAELLICHGCQINNEKEVSTPLHLASKAKFEYLVEILLSRKASVDARDETGRTSLLLAILSNCQSIVKLLLDHKASVDICSNYGDSPLVGAVQVKNAEIISMLLSHGADVNQKSTHSNTIPLIKAAKLGFDMVAEFLITAGASINLQNSYGESALLAAVKCKQFKLAILFLLAGADVNAKENSGCSALHYAAQQGRKKLCKLLLKFEANVNITNRKGESPLHLALAKDRYDVAELLLEAKADVNKKLSDGTTAIYNSSARGREKVFLLLLKFGAVIDIDTLRDGATILDHAVINGCSLIVKHVLDNCNIIKENFNYLFEVAVMTSNYNSHTVVKQLIDFGFYVSARDVSNKNLITGVIRNGYVQIFTDLLKFGLNVNLRIKKKGVKSHYIIHTAVIHKQKDITALLIANGAKVDVEDSDKKTPVMYAVRNADLKIAQLLLEKLGTNRNPINFFMAVTSGDLKMVKMFIDNGYEANVKDDGHSALMYVFANMKELKSSSARARKIANFLVSKGADIFYKPIITVIRELPIFQNGLLGYFLKEPIAVCTLLHVAAIDSNFEFFSWLVDSGLNVNCKTKGGLTPLHIASLMGNLKIVRKLINRRANPNCITDSGLTPVHLAAVAANICVFKYLLNWGCDINATDSKVKLDDFIDKSGERFEIDVFGLGNPVQVNMEEKLRTILENHVLKLRAADMFLNDHYLNLPIIHASSDFTEECDAEVTGMKTETVADVSITLHEILKCDLVRLVSYYGMKKLQTMYKCVMQLKEKYPLYLAMILIKLKMAARRKIALENSDLAFCCIFPSLPDFCRRKIMSYISDDELEELARHYKSTDNPATLST